MKPKNKQQISYRLCADVCVCMLGWCNLTQPLPSPPFEQHRVKWVQLKGYFRAKLMQICVLPVSLHSHALCSVVADGGGVCGGCCSAPGGMQILYSFIFAYLPAVCRWLCRTADKPLHPRSSCTAESIRALCAACNRTCLPAWDGHRWVTLLRNQMVFFCIELLLIALWNWIDCFFAIRNSAGKWFPYWWTLRLQFCHIKVFTAGFEHTINNIVHFNFKFKAGCFQI